MSQPLLEIRDLQVGYGPVRAVRGLSLSVPRGQTVCLLGANGAGKSSALRALAGLVPSQGSLRFDGEELGRLAPHRRVRRGLVLCPEGRGVLAGLTVAENLDLGAWVRGRGEAVRRDLEHVLSLFPRLRERLDQKAGTLSGGEQQMLAMGRALMASPKLLLLDEPSLGLAPQVVDLIFDIVQKVCAEGVSVLLVEQNAAAALEISRYAYVLENGGLALEGPAAEVAADERVRRAYLGG